MFKTIKDINLRHKRVLVRVDFNVPLTADGQVDSSEDWRIKRTLATLEYLQKQDAKIILLAHLGRPNAERNPEFSLRPVSEYLSRLIQPVIFIDDCCGSLVAKKVADLKSKEILFLENLRFYPGEETNDLDFSKKLAALGDVYINDAFANSHRAHASIVGLPKILPAVAGLLLAEEIEKLSPVRQKPKKPLTVLIGGVKISSKLKFIQHFLNTADSVVLGGALANTVLMAKGLAVGKSVVEETILEELRALNLTDPKLHLPVDAIVAAEPKAGVPWRVTAIGNTRDDEMILDIGPDTRRLFGDIVMQSSTVIWTGPMGLREVPAFSQGTEIIARAMTQGKAYTIVGGGDTTGIINKLNLADKIGYVSTGGSAMLDFLAGSQLPGLVALEY